MFYFNPHSNLQVLSLLGSSLIILVLAANLALFVIASLGHMFVLIIILKLLSMFSN